MLDTLDPPAVRRRGVPDAIQERLDDPGFHGSPFAVGSILRGLHRLSDATVVFHHDATLEPTRLNAHPHHRYHTIRSNRELRRCWPVV